MEGLALQAIKVNTTIVVGKVIQPKIHHAHIGAKMAATPTMDRAPTGAIHGTMFLPEDKVHPQTGEPQEVRAATVSLEVQQEEHHIAVADHTRGVEIKISIQV